MLSVIQNKVEPSIIAHGQDKGPKPPGWDRPFVETPSARRKPIKELIQHTVEFPERDESTGELVINYLGSRTEDFFEATVCVLSSRDIELGLIIVQALEILGTYLTSSPTAPLNKQFVEIESPLWYAWPRSLPCVTLTSLQHVHLYNGGEQSDMPRPADIRRFGSDRALGLI